MSLAIHHDSSAWAEARPILSVLIPFLRDDPTDLLQRLDAEAPGLAGQAELIVLDDGTNILPGHGGASTIGQERVSNPFLTGLAESR